MTWETAQNSCRTHHTDLAIVQSNENWMRLQEAANEKAYSGYNDINSWRWSYDGYGLGEECVVMYPDGFWQDYPCSDSFNFVCYDVKKKRQVIRVQVKSGQNVNEAKLKALVLNELKQMLINQDVTLTWRTQPDGKVFQKDRTVQKHSEANTTHVCSPLQ
ncbi:Aggrecan core protein [Labeo rohita]|uniref:Aggrecan core protein n=1 Tax=Labeo rohita TaxID=84645 RepID=A0ABQ8ML68_LABRO|nr:Aggrecan core protein [Labeo rohita]